MYYVTYVYPISKEARGYRIDTLDLDTYEKETISPLSEREDCRRGEVQGEWIG